MNTRLLRKIQKHILAEPKRFDMTDWVMRGKPGSLLEAGEQEIEVPKCGTVACIGGWACLLSGKTRLRHPKSFIANAIATLKEEFPELWGKQTDSQIEQLLYEQCERAKHYNINLSEGIYLMFTMRLRLGWDFPDGKDHAWAREILLRDLMPEAERTGALEAMLWGGDEDWI